MALEHAGSLIVSFASLCLAAITLLYFRKESRRADEFEAQVIAEKLKDVKTVQQYPRESVPDRMKIRREVLTSATWKGVGRQHITEFTSKEFAEILHATITFRWEENGELTGDLSVKYEEDMAAFDAHLRGVFDGQFVILKYENINKQKYHPGTIYLELSSDDTTLFGGFTAIGVKQSRVVIGEVQLKLP